ncbi:MAG TPA: alpha/beta fold hydrolase [Polyangiales bacterium]
MKSVFLTGVTGYLGSHVAASLLSHEDVQLTVLARPKRRQRPELRVMTALRTACQHAGISDAFLAEACQRLIVIEGDLLDDTLADKLRGRAIDEIWHCGARLAFADEQRRHLEEVNVRGTQRMLELAAAAGRPVFNYVSTAYVHGDVTGVVGETLPDAANAPNNHYEDSKRRSERAVLAASTAHGFPCRIFRPSIIVGHSQTGQGDTLTGLYGFLLLAVRLKRELNGKMPGFLEKFPLQVFTELDTGLNLIPIDRVVEQMLAVAGRADTFGTIFNIVSENNVSFEQLALQTRAELGVDFVATRDANGLGPVDHLINRHVQQFAPYLTHGYTFDNANTRAAYPDMGDNRVDQELVNRLVRSFCATNAFVRVNQDGSKSWLEGMEKREHAGALGSLTYYVGGRGSRTVMIFNAYGQSLYFWNAIGRSMLAEYRVIVWEMRGTSCVAGGLNAAFPIEQHVTDALAILEAEQIERADLVGWCTGPKLTIELCRRAPEKVNSLTLITPCFKDFPGQAHMDTQYERHMEPVCKRAVAYPEVASTARRALSAILSGKQPTGELGPKVSAILELMNEEVRSLVVAPFVDDVSLLRYAEQLLTFWAHDVSPALPHVHVPVLLITGERDEIASPVLATEVVRAIPTAREAQLIGGNHYVHYEKPALVFDLVHGFLQEPDETRELPGVKWQLVESQKRGRDLAPTRQAPRAGSIHGSL